MTADVRASTQERLDQAEQDLREAWTAALSGGAAEREDLAAAIARCRDARLRARGRWNMQRQITW